MRTCLNTSPDRFRFVAVVNATKGSRGFSTSSSEVTVIMRKGIFLVSAYLLAASIPAFATIFASLHGVVHDPQHRPLAGAHIALQATNSDFLLSSSSNADGEFDLSQVPIGAYKLSASASGFGTIDQTITLASGTNPIVHVALPVASATETVVIESSQVQVDTVTPTTLVSRQMIEETPGAGRVTSYAAITDYVPGAYMTHDMLHMRGGHQTSWLIDGVNIPNTNIAANVGPQIAPGDMGEIEIQRGSYAADIGDRTYGVFNVEPRNGFERDHEGELHITGGNLGTGEVQLSAGDHSLKSAWYASLIGTRSDYGLETPIAGIFNDATNSESGFGSLIVNPNASNQLRFNGQLRQDYFQVPYDPDPSSWENQLYDSSGLRDGQTERDGFLIADWVHTISPRAMFEAAPFYHWNVANYDSKPADSPLPLPGIAPPTTQDCRRICAGSCTVTTLQPGSIPFISTIPRCSALSSTMDRERHPSMKPTRCRAAS